MKGNYWPENRLHPEAAEFLREQGAMCVGVLTDRRDEIWEVGSGGFTGPTTWWRIFDNGGEVAVQKINHWETLVSVAEPAPRVGMKPVTFGWRIWTVMQGRPVDCQDLSLG